MHLELPVVPFAWTKPTDAIIKSHRRRLKRVSTAVHESQIYAWLERVVGR